MRFIQRLGTPCCPIPSKEHFTTLLILTEMLGDYSIDLKFFHSNNGLNWIEGQDSNEQTKAIVLANDEYLFLMNITANNIYSSPADPISNDLDIEEYLSLLKNYSSIEYYYPKETLSLVGLEVHTQAITIEGDVQVFKDQQCTEYATGAEQTVYVRFNTAVGFGEGFTAGDGSVQGNCFSVTAPSEGHEDDPYFVLVWDMWGSDDFVESFTEGQVIECTNTDPDFEPISNVTTVFQKPNLVASIWMDFGCTERPRVGSSMQMFYIKIDRATDPGDTNWNQEGLPILLISNPSEEFPDDPAWIGYYTDFISDNFYEHLIIPGVYELNDVTEVGLTFTQDMYLDFYDNGSYKTHPQPDYKNIVGSYVYSDGTLGSTVKEGIVGVVAIPANACPDNKARIVPISGATANLKWANDDYANMSALSDLGVSADDSFPYINDGFNITNTVLGVSDFVANGTYGPMFWIEPTPLLLAAWNDNASVTVSLSLQTESLYIGYFTPDYEESDFKVLPVPYLADGTPNPYIKTMNGWNEGTANATKLSGKSPLFDFASTFNKEGFPTGSWFIPSFPELIMLFGKYATIYNAISAANGDVSWLVSLANEHRVLWCSQCIGALFEPNDDGGYACDGYVSVNEGSCYSYNSVNDFSTNFFGVPMAKLS